MFQFWFQSSRAYPFALCAESFRDLSNVLDGVARLFFRVVVQSRFPHGGDGHAHALSDDVHRPQRDDENLGILASFGADLLVVQGLACVRNAGWVDTDKSLLVAL